MAQIPWGHNILLLEKEKDLQKRLWYAAKTIENGWSRSVLTYQVETDLYGRQMIEGKSHNFERDLETALLLKIRDFLPELGQGSASMEMVSHHSLL